MLDLPKWEYHEERRAHDAENDEEHRVQRTAAHLDSIASRELDSRYDFCGKPSQYPTKAVQCSVSIQLIRGRDETSIISVVDVLIGHDGLNRTKRQLFIVSRPILQDAGDPRFRSRGHGPQRRA